MIGSAAVWDFGTYAPACTCKSLRVKLSPTVVFTRLEDTKKMWLKLFVEPTLRCTGGVGDCTGGLFLESVTPGARVAEFEEFIMCTGPCRGASRQLYAVRLYGDQRFGFGRRGTGTGALYARVAAETECNGKTRIRKFLVFFDADTGKLDYDKSDLNGDGKADGA